MRVLRGVLISALFAAGCGGGTTTDSADAAVIIHMVDAAGQADVFTADASAPDVFRPDVSTPTLDGSPAGSGTVRIMAANISSGNNQSYDPGEGIRIFQGTHPDIVLIQEFNYGTDDATAMRGFVDTAFGTTFSYYREPGALQIPNGVISRYPIIASGSWTDPKVANRGFAWAKIDVPGPKDLWVVSLHLLTSNATDRNAEATAVVADVLANIPADDYLVIGGDFNTGTRSEACVTTLAQVVSTAAPYPADNAGNDNTSEARTKPHDWVLPSANLRAKETPVAIGAQMFTNGLVVDSRVYTPLADLSPMLITDSSATGMQHMPVIIDFAL